MNTRPLLLILTLYCVTAAGAEPPTTGPVIEGWGPVYDVPAGSFNLAAESGHRVLFDIGEAPDDPSGLNRSIESAARFLNMQARSGIDPDRISIAIVLHGPAAAAALGDEAYRSRNGVDNPNRSLIEALSGHGVRFFLCGQTAGHRGYRTDELLPTVTLAVSAMTAHVRLQEEGYRAILF